VLVVVVVLGVPAIILVKESEYFQPSPANRSRMPTVVGLVAQALARLVREGQLQPILMELLAVAVVVAVLIQLE
jgi:hypothetical protein